MHYPWGICMHQSQRDSLLVWLCGHFVHFQLIYLYSLPFLVVNPLGQRFWLTSIQKHNQMQWSWREWVPKFCMVSVRKACDVTLTWRRDGSIELSSIFLMPALKEKRMRCMWSCMCTSLLWLSLFIWVNRLSLLNFVSSCHLGSHHKLFEWLYLVCSWFSIPRVSSAFGPRSGFLYNANVHFTLVLG